MTYPEAPEQPQVWELCRDHDDSLKIEVIRSRPKRQPDASRSAVEIRCEPCEALLSTGDAVCPNCGPAPRSISVEIHEGIELHDSVTATVTPAGERRWATVSQSGDSYTVSLARWGKLERFKDRRNNLYRETVTLYDGTRFESIAKLTSHTEPRRRRKRS